MLFGVGVISTAYLSRSSFFRRAYHLHVPLCGVQKLLPSNVKPFDRFGASVSIDGDALIVGSHQEFEEGKLAYQRAVQVW